MNTQIKQNVLLRPLSSFGIGGDAKEYVQVRSTEELLNVLKVVENKHITYKIFAGGSNIVFPDAGVKGLIIHIVSGKSLFEGNLAIAEAGVPLEDVVNGAILRGLSGMESLSGIPGTIGGAVVGNAGAYGRSISDILEKVEVWNGNDVIVLTNSQCQFSYRESIFKKTKLIVLKVFCRLQSGDSNELQEVSRDIIAKRQAKYKPGVLCPGSFFKNILFSDLEEDETVYIDRAHIIAGKLPAGFLLEKVGAKGMRVGGIFVSDVHANLLVNDGTGTAGDVKKLAKILKKKVKEKFGIELEEEVRYF